MFGLSLLQHPGHFVHSITLLSVGSVCRCLIQSVFEVSEVERNQRVLTMFYPHQMLSVIIAGFISVNGKFWYILVKVIHSFAYILYIVLKEDISCNFSSSYFFTLMVHALKKKKSSGIMFSWIFMVFFVVFFVFGVYFCFRRGSFKTGKAIYRIQWICLSFIAQLWSLTPAICNRVANSTHTRLSTTIEWWKQSGSC